MEGWDPNKPTNDYWDNYKAEYRTRHPVNVYLIGIVAVFIAGIIAMWAFPADAHEWYDRACCDNRDCREISGLGWSEITESADHYIWKSSQSGRVHKFKKDSPLVKPSQDGKYHGCETPNTGVKMCLYIPVMF